MHSKRCGAQLLISEAAALRTDPSDLHSVRLMDQRSHKIVDFRPVIYETAPLIVRQPGLVFSERGGEQQKMFPGSKKMPSALRLRSPLPFLGKFAKEGQSCIIGTVKRNGVH